MKVFAAIVSSALLVGSLAGCASESSPDCTPLANSGSAVDSVKVTGDFGTPPFAEFATPLTVEKTERKVLSEGDGNVAYPGTTVAYELTIFDGKTGDEIGRTSYDGSQLLSQGLDPNSMVAGLVATIQCATAGSQIVSVISPTDLSQLQNTSTGLDPEATVIAVVDLMDVSLTKANGKDQEIPDGLPQVSLDSDGVPTITVPDTAPPTELEVAVLKEGDGKVVQPDDTVTIHYKGVLWSNGEQFDSSWDRGQPAIFNLGAVISGFSEALVGQKVGSQILTVIPPELGYGAEDTGSIPGGSTLVFVIDILMTQPTAQPPQ